ncbi:MAG: hypothetical protein COB17_04280 [Sulfurimonas sp.]|nr:MAG: hypothetical protein COB17_04280 [Sulfurimonas sp.]
MKFNYKAQIEDMLLRYARLGLSERIDDLPDLGNTNSYDEKFAKYEKYIIQEILVLKEISFDGYMLLLQDVLVISKEISDFVKSYGSVKYSLTAYVLGITDEYVFNEIDNIKEFINFTPFTKKPKVNILISSFANAGCIGYIKHKYPDIIKKVKKRAVIFNDGFEIKFIDLGIDIKVEETDLDTDTLSILKINKII